MKTSNKFKWLDNSLTNKIKWKVRSFMKKENIKNSTKSLIKMIIKKETKTLKRLKRF